MKLGFLGLIFTVYDRMLGEPARDILCDLIAD
jgi:hypothetical protein